MVARAVVERILQKTGGAAPPKCGEGGAGERKRAYEMVQQKREELSRCLRNSYDDYDSDWRAECRRIRSPSGCRLPEKEVVRMDRRYREDQEDCYKKYNQS